MNWLCLQYVQPKVLSWHDEKNVLSWFIKFKIWESRQIKRFSCCASDEGEQRGGIGYSTSTTQQNLLPIRRMLCKHEQYLHKVNLQTCLCVTGQAYTKAHWPAGGSLYHYKVKWFLVSFSAHTSHVCFSAAQQLSWLFSQMLIPVSLSCHAQCSDKERLHAANWHFTIAAAAAVHIYKLHIITNQMYAAVHHEKPTVLHRQSVPTVHEIERFSTVFKTAYHLFLFCTIKFPLQPLYISSYVIQVLFPSGLPNTLLSPMPCQPNNNIRWAVSLQSYTHNNPHSNHCLPPKQPQTLQTNCLLKNL